MEYLGDAMIGAIVADYLTRRYPDQREGMLSKLRSKIVNGNMQASIARALGFGKHLVVSRQLEMANARNNSKILEDCFEAFVAAIYSDFNSRTVKGGAACISGQGVGFLVLSTWLKAVLEAHVDFGEIARNSDHNKERLSRHMPSLMGDTPEYVDAGVREDGTVSVVVRCGDQVISAGEGSTRKEAEQAAAQAALKYMGYDAVMASEARA
jgi:ribonuclease-3